MSILLDLDDELDDPLLGKLSHAAALLESALFLHEEGCLTSERFEQIKDVVRNTVEFVCDEEIGELDNE